MPVRALFLILVAALGAAALTLWTPPPAPELRDHVSLVEWDADGPVLSVAAFGSSLTKRALWTEDLRERLRFCLRMDVIIEVVARAGAGSGDGLTLIETYRPETLDLALVEYAMNDADIIDGTTLKESVANHERMIARLREAHPRIAIVLVATNPVRGLQKLKRPRLMAYYDAIAAIAAKDDVSFLDGTGRWHRRGPTTAAIPDGVHPDPEIEAALYGAPLADLVLATLGRDCAS